MMVALPLRAHTMAVAAVRMHGVGGLDNDDDGIVVDIVVVAAAVGTAAD